MPPPCKRCERARVPAIVNQTLEFLTMTTVLLSSAILVTTLGIASTAAGAQAKPAPAPKPAAAARTITIEGNDAMKFSPAAISAKPGETIQIAVLAINSPFGNPPGNFIFFRPTVLRFLQK